MQFGFSAVGLVMLVMLFVPNIIWGRRQPLGYSEIAERESPALCIHERVGQVAVTASALVFVCPEGYGHALALVARAGVCPDAALRGCLGALL